MKYWLWLNNISGLGPVLSKLLLKTYKTPVRIYKCTEDELLLIDGIGPTLSKKILDSRSLEKATEELKHLTDLNIKLLTFNDKRYPVHAKLLHDSPSLLFYKGSLKRSNHYVFVTGNHSASDYGQIVANKACNHLIKANSTLIGGLTKGIESASHTVFCKQNAYQVAFVAHGLDQCYPAEHRKLMEQITRNGVVISQYGLGTKPIKGYFLKRNDLMVSWANDILLVEARQRSSFKRIISTCTDLNKKLHIVPHELFKEYAKGSLEILKETGKVFVTNDQLTPHFTLDKLNEKSNAKDKIKTHNTKEDFIIESLKVSNKSIDELSFELKVNTLDIIEALTMLELDSIVEQLPGSKYKLIDLYP